MGLCSKLNAIITFVVIVLASLWFLLVAVVPQPGSSGSPLPRHSDSPQLPVIPLHNLAQQYPFPYAARRSLSWSR